MNLYIACLLLAGVLLHCAEAVAEWEVINDVKPYDDSGSQDDILSREEFLPIRANKPRPKSSPLRPPQNVDSVNKHKVTKAPSLPAKGGNVMAEEQLMPLGVANHASRRLLEVVTEFGPKLPIELQRKKLSPEAVNLSTACKDTDDFDCVFDVEEYLAKQTLNGDLDKAEKDFSFVDQRQDVVPVQQELLSRHRRQAVVDDTVEGSGLEATENFYQNNTDHVNEGQYFITSDVGISYPQSTLTETEQQQFQSQALSQLIAIFKNTLPGFQNALVGPPVFSNGVLKSKFTLVIDGSMLTSSANNLGVTNLEEYLLNGLRNATGMIKNNLTIFQKNLVLFPGDGFINRTLDTLYDYCGSLKPCHDEYNVTACFNTGFMSGSCPHKCDGHRCQNYAVCEINENYEPVCNCGERYEGTYCETKKKSKKGLTTGETVGVGVAGSVLAASVLVCCIYIAFCRRSKGFKYTYYEDEGATDNLTDPTSIANYYIDRPIISATPIPVFNSQEGFEA